VTSGSSGFGFGSGGRHRGRFSESAKSVAAIMTGIAALLVAVAGTITLVCSDPEGNPASAVTTTAVGAGDTPGGGGDGGGSAGGAVSGTASDTSSPAPSATSATSAISTTSGSSGASSLPLPSSSSPTPSAPTTAVSSTDGGTLPTSGASTPQTPPAPRPQWEGDLQIDPVGYSLATVPPSPDQSGDPDISASFDGTFVAGLGAAKWTGAAAPSPRACARLITAQNATHVTADPGDVYCVRVAHGSFNIGNQYAAVRILEQGLDATDLPYVRIHATVWPDGQ
jgi:hypothetical protein